MRGFLIPRAEDSADYRDRGSVGPVEVLVRGRNGGESACTPKRYAHVRRHTERTSMQWILEEVAARSAYLRSVAGAVSHLPPGRPGLPRKSR
jgi:hypothetical protein